MGYGNKYITVMIILLVLSLSVSGVIQATETGQVDISSCIFDGLSAFKITNLAVNEVNGYVYALGNSAGSNIAVIAIINASDRTNPVLDSCFNTGLVRADTVDINWWKRETLSESGILSVPNNQPANFDINFYNTSLAGDTLTLFKAFNLGGSVNDQIKEAQQLNLITATTALGVELTDNNLQEFNLVTGSQVNNVDVDLTPNLNGMSAPLGTTNAFHLVSGTSGAQLIKDGTSKPYKDSFTCTFGTGSVYDRLDQFQNKFVTACVSTVRLYNFDESIGNITSTISASHASSEAIAEFMTTNLLLVHNGSNRIIQYFTQNMTVAETFLLNNSDLSAMEYFDNHLYVLDNSERVVIYEIVPSELIKGINKKPRFLTHTTADDTPTVLTDVIVTATLDNPETLSASEDTIFGTTCTYEETTQIEQTFEVNISFCNGQTSIGNFNGIDFGFGQNISVCSETLQFGASFTGSLQLSFDVHTTSAGNATFAWTQFDGTGIGNFNVVMNTTDLTVETLGENIFDNLQTSGFPTRLFFTLDTNGFTGFTNVMAVGTNLLGTSAVLDEVFCNSEEFCFIGDNRVSLTNPVNVGGFKVVSSTGDLIIDNIRLKTVVQYPTGVADTSLIRTSTCNFATFGVFTTRSYADDDLYERSYLIFSDLTHTVTSTGLPTGSVGNISIGAILTDISSIAGFGDVISLALLALIFIGGITFGAIRLTDGSAQAGIFSGAIATLFFSFLGWLPIIGFVILILLSAGLITWLGSRLFFGGN